MTKTEAQDRLERMIRYCWGHTDTDDEEDLVVWMARHVGREFGLEIRHAKRGDGSTYFDVVRVRGQARV